MPLTMTHAYIAKDIYNNLNEKIKKKIDNSYLDELLVFSKGFDVFFFYFDFKNIKHSIKILNYGKYFHNHKTNEFFINLTNKVKETKDIDEFLFLIGLITHYVADKTIHPYVNYKATTMLKPHTTKKDWHFMIESYFDNYLVRERESGNYLKYKIYEGASFDLKRNNKIIRLLNDSFEEVFKVSNMGENYYLALSKMKRFFKYLRHDTFGYKRIFYLSVNFLAKRLFRDVSYLSYHFKLDRDSEILNLNHQDWYNIHDKKYKSNESLLELYNKVIKEGTDIINDVYDYVFLDKKIDLEKLYQNKSYSNGLTLSE